MFKDIINKNMRIKKNRKIFFRIFIVFILTFVLFVFGVSGSYANCTGRTITYVGNDVVHTFTSSGTLSCAGSISVQYLIVAGGGGETGKTWRGSGTSGQGYSGGKGFQSMLLGEVESFEIGLVLGQETRGFYEHLIMERANSWKKEKK